jgi:hypothetical protein
MKTTDIDPNDLAPQDEPNQKENFNNPQEIYCWLASNCKLA